VDSLELADLLHLFRKLARRMTVDEILADHLHTSRRMTVYAAAPFAADYPTQEEIVFVGRERL
jgi:hypothetical protein